MYHINENSLENNDNITQTWENIINYTLPTDTNTDLRFNFKCVTCVAVTEMKIKIVCYS